MEQTIIFTDLDGSLLDYGNYSFAAAIPSLDRIKRAGIPLIFTTSKTRKEVELLQRDIGMQEPMIVENGGGIFFPQGYRNLTIGKMQRKTGCGLIVVGTTYARIRRFVQKVAPQFGLRGFGDMTSAEIAERTGLPMEKAVLAKEREFTEPFIIGQPDDLELLRETAAAEGFKITRGGLFYHLIGVNQDKGKAVRILCDIFERSFGMPLTTIGLGDSENDAALLEKVDIPVLIPRPGKGYLDIRLPRLIRAAEPGAKGWNEAMQRLLNERQASPIPSVC